MPGRSHVMILHSGGLRSLVATAAVLNRADSVRVTLVYVDDGRPAGATRLEHVRRQADHYALNALLELPLAHLYGQPTYTPEGLPRATLGAAQMLLATLAAGLDRRADEVVWPVAVNGEPPRIAAAQEQQILCQQLAEAEPVEGAAEGAGLTVPLLGYTDRQVVELGAGLGVPWELAFSCVQKGDAHCGACPACRRRQAAFRAAGVVDPVFAPARL